MRVRKAKPKEHIFEAVHITESVRSYNLSQWRNSIIGVEHKEEGKVRFIVATNGGAKSAFIGDWLVDSGRLGIVIWSDKEFREEFDLVK